MKKWIPGDQLCKKDIRQYNIIIDLRFSKFVKFIPAEKKKKKKNTREREREK